MRLAVEISDEKVRREYRNFLEWTGEDTWKEKIEKLKRSPRLSDQDLYRQYLVKKNPLLIPIERYLHLESSGGSIAKHLSPQLVRTAGYLHVVNRLASQGDEQVLRKLKGFLIDDDSAAPFLFEIDLAVHFFRLGYEVEFMDLESKADYDLLVSNGHYELEIECKRKSADAGRKIVKRDFHLLCDIFFSSFEDTKRQFAVLIKSEGRMEAGQDLFHKLVEEIRVCLTANRKNGQVYNLEFTIESLPENLQIKTAEKAAEILLPYYSTSAHYAVFSNRYTTFVIKCESTEKNKVLDAIYDELKHGATQFSGTRAGLLACFLEDIDDGD